MFNKPQLPLREENDRTVKKKRQKGNALTLLRRNNATIHHLKTILISNCINHLNNPFTDHLTDR